MDFVGEKKKKKIFVLPVDKTVCKGANFSSKTVPFFQQYHVQPYQRETVQPLAVDKMEISDSLSQGHR